MADAEDSGKYVIQRVEAQRRATLIQVAALVGAGLCVALSAALQGPINRQREELELVMHSDIYKALPPEYAWATAFGGAFRGIAVDFLWIRADRLKEEGKYYESHQLAKWICTLQPRFAEVWSFHSWNMSYNISVATHTPQERWQWVYNGIRLLRDQGIPNNERVVPLYRQLAWTWYHKAGQRQDDFHHTYKRWWAATMQTLLGEPPVGASDAETIAWFKRIADVPSELDNLIAQHPGVADLVKQLDELGIDVEADTDIHMILHPLETGFFQPYTRYLHEKTLSALRNKPRDLSEKDRELNELFAQAPAEDFEALLAFMRAKVLREQYKMDTDFMLELTGRLGTDQPIPIDWRTPWAQSLYWSAYGVKQAGNSKHLSTFDHINVDRIQLFSLAEMAKEGQFTLRVNLDDPMKSFLALTPDLRYIEAMHKKYIELGQTHADPGEDVENRTTDMLRSGHVNNLENAIVALYMAGREDKARFYQEYLATHYPDRNTGEIYEPYLQPLQDFIMSYVRDMAGSYAEALRLIVMTLEGGYMALATGRDNEYQTAIRRAREIHEYYQKEEFDTRQGRTKLLEFEQIRSLALYRFVTNSQAFGIAARVRVWNAARLEVRQGCYDYVIGLLTAECEEQGLAVAIAFPEPEGMAQWRETHEQPELEEDVWQKRDTEERPDEFEKYD